MSALSGVARPNIAAFESGRREPRWHTAVRTLEATGATIDIESVVDGALLVDAWPDLILPAGLRSAWRHLIDRAHTKDAEAP